MITVGQVGWTSYLQYEGPWFRGQQGLASVGPEAAFDQKVLAVITATEGGHFDAINMYDRMICSVGLIQWGDAGQFSVCDMLGEVSSADPSALAPLLSYVSSLGYGFSKTAQGWRFTKDGDVVNTVAKQQQLYLKGCDGLKGHWSTYQRSWATGFVAAMQAVWDGEAARGAQMKYTSARLQGFAMPQAKLELFHDPAARDADQNLVQAAQAAFLSFAANLPAVAAAQLAKVDDSLPKWSLAWLDGMLKQLTFGPQIAIYPHRYNAILPVLERLWGVVLPDSADHLAAWHADMGIDPEAPPEVRLDSPLEIQNALVSLGYDIGPSGADGVFGTQSKAAIMVFQSASGLTADGVVGPKTLDALRAASTKS